MKTPVLFIGHGSPMNIVQKNKFTMSLETLGQTIKKPKAICIISAHWQTQGIKVHCGDRAKQIYDFFGFPDELYRVVYNPVGAPAYAKKAAELSGGKCDSSWGNDHAAWSVLLHMYPEADIPVFYMSSDMTADYQTLFNAAANLKPLRENGVLFIGSGNIVHNLRNADFFNENAEPNYRGVEFDTAMKGAVMSSNMARICDPMKLGECAKFSIPTKDHYIPFVMACGLKDKTDTVSFPCEIFQNASVSMRSVMFA
ncbi:class III extradiol ring-cleavage dioxygenase [Seleniivibrio sp.]|uniref:dioxygenase family protein n=1 Tax=Seleniivibrio sp. TaxID=2898801 RepID=UPI0025F49D85|nr:class III extradiol ring-cleavage dioxygenase [Seleniivibrio sp.]MCD8553732.1 dioxygenase [Seleniivibrio sp.]